MNPSYFSIKSKITSGSIFNRDTATPLSNYVSIYFHCGASSGNGAVSPSSDAGLINYALVKVYVCAQMTTDHHGTSGQRSWVSSDVSRATM